MSRRGPGIAILLISFIFRFENTRPHRYNIIMRTERSRVTTRRGARFKTLKDYWLFACIVISALLSYERHSSLRIALRVESGSVGDKGRIWVRHIVRHETHLRFDMCDGRHLLNKRGCCYYVVRRMVAQAVGDAAGPPGTYHVHKYIMYRYAIGYSFGRWKKK